MFAAERCAGKRHEGIARPPGNECGDGGRKTAHRVPAHRRRKKLADAWPRRGASNLLLPHLAFLDEQAREKSHHYRGEPT